MKKFILPLALLISWAMTSCSSDEEFIADYDQDFSEWSIDGIPVWLSKGFATICEHQNTGKYDFSSNSIGYMEWKMAKIHKVDSKQYVSLARGYARDRISDLIIPERLSDNEELLYNDASTDIRKLGYYDLFTGFFTPGGKIITDENLIEQILSETGEEISYIQIGHLMHQNDRTYGFDDSAEWIKPHFAEALKTMCEERVERYGDRLFLCTIGSFCFYIEHKTTFLTEEDTDGRGTPFVLEAYTRNDDHSLTRYIESFIADDNGVISPFSFQDVEEIAIKKGDNGSNPLNMRMRLPVSLISN